MEKYNIDIYSDEELYEIIGYTEPDNQDLEAILIDQLKNYMYDRTTSGIRMFNFLKNIYTHFFNTAEETSDTSDNFDYSLEELETTNFDKTLLESQPETNENTIDVYDVTTPENPDFDDDINSYSNQELYNVLDLSNDPEDSVLEAKIIQMLQLYSGVTTEQGERMYNFYKDIYDRFFVDKEPDLTRNEGDEEFNQDQTIIKKDDPKDTIGNNIEYSKNIDYTPGKVNPILKETYKRTISIDSQYRDEEYPSATNFTLNFTETLKDVVSMKLYAVQIPVTWYTISSNYGSNFFFLKPIENENTMGIYNQESHIYKVEIEPGNYTPTTLTSAIQTQMSNLSSTYSDVSFGNTQFSYDSSNAKSTFTINLQKIYNESYYYLDFTNAPNSKTLLNLETDTIAMNSVYSSPIDYDYSYNIATYSIDDNINTIDIIHYVPNGTTTTYDSQTSTVLQTIPITLDNTSSPITASEILDNINDKLQANAYLHEDTNVSLVPPNNDDEIYYQWTIRLNRYTTQNVLYSKIAVIFPDANSDPNAKKMWENVFKAPSDTIYEISHYNGLEDLSMNNTIDFQEDETIVFRPKEDKNGGVYINDNMYSDYNDIVINIPKASYDASNIVQLINTNISQIPEIKNTVFSIVNDLLFIEFNINKIYTTKDYALVFYDDNSFVKCTNVSNSYRNASADTTLGYILGYKELSIYELSESNLTSTSMFQNPDTLMPTNSVYSVNNVYDSDGLITNTTIILRGNATLNIYLYNYFMIILDDYNQNHLNDGLVTVAKRDTSVTLPTYANRKNYRACDAVTGELASPETETPSFPTQGLTQKQVYSVEQILAEQNKVRDNMNSGPFIKDMFALLPIKASGATPGTIYVEFGGTLQQQERIYFGPVNIRRLTIKLINDKGDVVDLNGANWSFQLVCEQLYSRGNQGSP